MLPDGTFFQVRNGRNGPAPLKIPDNLTNEKVVLAREHHLFVGEIVRNFQRGRAIAPIANLEKRTVG